MNSNSFFVSRGRQGKNQVATTEGTSGRLEADSPVIVSLAEEIQSSTPSKSGRGGILSPTPLPPSSPSLSSPSISHRYCSNVKKTLYHSSKHPSLLVFSLPIILQNNRLPKLIIKGLLNH